MEAFTGKVWVLGDDIDTDIIIPTEYLALKTIDDMKQYGFSPLRPELAGQIEKGDIIVAGKNFGCGSSREQAPEIIKALGISCVIAKSFARIFFRSSAGEPDGYHSGRRPGKGNAQAQRTGLRAGGRNDGQYSN